MSSANTEPAGAPAEAPRPRSGAARWLVPVALCLVAVSAISAYRPFGSLEDVAKSALAIASTPSVQSLRSFWEAPSPSPNATESSSTAHGAGADSDASSSPKPSEEAQPSRSVAPQSSPSGAVASPAAQPAGAGASDADADGDGLPDYLKNTAVVTLATGDDAAKLAVAWAQSLRDSKTRIPTIVVLLSRGGLGSANCNDAEWKRAHQREHVACSGPDTIAEEIISEQYVRALERLQVKVQVIDPIPDTPYTQIPGGRQIFWGMAFNKLRIFDPNYMPYRKLLWMDADTLVLKNIDHLLKEPMFTAAFTYACCNQNGPAQPSGGMWIVEPSKEVAGKLQSLIDGPVPGTNEVWHWGDMQVVRYLFGAPPPAGTEQPLWPAIEDGRHGYIEGLEHLPETEGLRGQELDNYLLRMPPAKREGPGFLPSRWDGKDPKFVWKALSVLYDQCVGHCECLPGRDIPTKYYSIHFSCIQKVSKPSHYASDLAFKTSMYNEALSCTRYYFMLWLSFYEKAMGERLPAPYYEGPEVPLYDAAHDEVVRAKRASAGQLL